MTDTDTDTDTDTNTESRGLQPVAMTLSHNGAPVNVTVSGGPGFAVNIAATGEDALKLAAMLEADILQRAGQITLTQAKARVRDRQASPVAHMALQHTEALQQALSVLRELHSVCVLMDHPDQDKRPTEDEYQAAMAAAARELGRN